MKFNSFSDLDLLLPGKTPATLHQSKTTHNGKGATVRISLDTKGRKGKSFTVLSGLHHNPATLKDIARILKEHLGTGGTVKGNLIELQGDQRERVTLKLQEMNYAVISR